MDSHWHSADDDRDTLSQADGYREPEQLCPHCQATEAEGHHEKCPSLKVPICHLCRGRHEEKDCNK